MDRQIHTGMTVLRHAAENAGNDPISDENLVAILRGEGGTGSQLRAVFGDASLQALAEAGASRGVPLATILAAYAAARASAAAANTELDEALAEAW